MLINNPAFTNCAEIIRDKGTNRSQFFLGKIDKYTWVDHGSSYLPGEIIAALLWAQIVEAEAITAHRLSIWNRYHDAFEPFESRARMRRPVIPEACEHNAHIYYLLLRHLADRTSFISAIKSEEINCIFHYVSLYTSPTGQKVGKTRGGLTTTDKISETFVRLPLWIDIEERQGLVIGRLTSSHNEN